jgi:hypothetical protein
VLTAALENSADAEAAAKMVRRLKHQARIRDLEEAKKIAAYRSGARGLKARKELRALEEELEASLKAYVSTRNGATVFFVLMGVRQLGIGRGARCEHHRHGN